MNQINLMGRLTRDPEMSFFGTDKNITVTRYTLAVDKRTRGDGENNSNADFIPGVTFGKTAEFAAKHLKKGIRIGVSGRLSSGSYTDRNGERRSTMNVIVEEQYFADSKAALKAGNIETENPFL